MIVPGVSPRFYGQETVLAVFVRQDTALAAEVGVERSPEVVETMGVTPGSIGLPDFDQRPGERVPFLVEHASLDDHALTEGFTRTLARQVMIRRGDGQIIEYRAGSLGESV